MKHDHRAKCHFPTLKNQGAKMIPVQSILFPRVLQEPNTLLVPGVRVISPAESRKYYKHTQHTKPQKLRHYLPGTLQQFVPADTAVHNQQDRRRASDGGRATEGERYMYTANTPVPAVAYHVHIVRYTRYISAPVSYTHLTLPTTPYV